MAPIVECGILSSSVVELALGCCCAGVQVALCSPVRYVADHEMVPNFPLKLMAGNAVADTAVFSASLDSDQLPARTEEREMIFAEAALRLAGDRVVREESRDPLCNDRRSDQRNRIGGQRRDPTEGTE